MNDNNKLSIEDLMKPDNLENQNVNFNNDSNLQPITNNNEKIENNVIPNDKKKKHFNINIILLIAVIIVVPIAIYLTRQDTAPEVCKEDIGSLNYVDLLGITNIYLDDNTEVYYRIPNNMSDEEFEFYVIASRLDDVRIDVCYKVHDEHANITKFTLRDKSSSNLLKSTNLKDFLNEIGEIPLGDSSVDATVQYDMNISDYLEDAENEITVQLDNGKTYVFVSNNDYDLIVGKKYKFNINVTTEFNELKYSINNVTPLE